MKNLTFLFLLVLSISAIAQNGKKVDVPPGVVYNYCKPALLQKAKTLVSNELKGTPSYELCGKILFVGPVLWQRFRNIPALQQIEGGNLTLRVDDQELSGKMTQDIADTHRFWDALRSEIGAESFVLREATARELSYYWSVISFDIDEPLIIVETKAHRYILNIVPKTMQLVWLDEAP
jgi:hypothetical protein